MNYWTLAGSLLTTLALLAIISWMKRLNAQHLAVAHSVRDLTATVAALQKDRQTQRSANAPPVGAFSFKGSSHG